MINNIKKATARVPGIFWGVLLVSLFFALTTKNFTKLLNIENILRNSAILLLVAVGQTMAIMAAKIDLSVGGIMTFSGMVSAVYLHTVPEPGVWHVLLALGIAVAVGAAFGLFNGLMIGVFKHDNWLITFSTMSICFGLAQVITGGNIVSGFNKAVRFLGDGKLGNISVLLLLTFILIAAMVFVLRNTRFGMHIYAVGDSEQCASQSGVDVKKTVLFIYILSGIFAGLSGFLLLSKTNSMSPIAADGYEFNAIAAAIVGGTTFDGGKGGLGGTVLGTLFIMIVKNGLQLIGLSVYWQQTCVGIFILGIIMVDVLRERTKAKKAMRRIYLHE